MTLDPNLLDQAYHLFVEESLELLQQIQELLIALPHDSSPIVIHKLLRTAGTIRSGADQVKLTDIYNLARRFEDVCRLLWQKKISVDSELDNLLWQAYDCLRLSLSAQMRLEPEETTVLLAQAEEVFSQLEARLDGKSKNEKGLLTLNDLEENEIELFSKGEVTQALNTLKSLLDNPKPQLEEALKMEIETILRLGEIWDISAFIAIAQMSLAALQISPQTAPTIGKLALTGFQGAWEALENNERESESVALELSPWEEAEPKSLSPASRGEIRESKTLENTLAGAIAPLNSTTLLKTAKLFIWLTSSTIFIISSESIKEILLSPKEGLASDEREQWLQWRGQQIPIYRLSNFLQYNCHYRLSKEENSALLVITRSQQTLALEIEIERSIAEPELTILPFNHVLEPPEYCYGCILLNEDRLAVAIDLEILLAQTVDLHTRPVQQSPLVKTAFAPTILVIDDSNTSRQLLALTLQKEGYQTIQARDGEEGIQQMRQNPAIDLVVSDIEMPKLNGFGFLQFCHNDSHLAKIPIILLSSYKSVQHRKMAMDLGAAACLGKPFDQQELLSILNNFLRRKIS
jgi:chemotaxis protein histidine kinase CheA/ActR/RegA family two-component response regulator